MPFHPARNNRHFDVLIVGAGHAGAQVAAALRQRSFEGTIGLLGDEPELPYERPPLSKDYLAGERPFERMLLRLAGFWEERRISVLPGMSVEDVEVGARIVTTAEGVRISYGSLIWATGGRPRRLACVGGELAGVHVIRSRADVDRLAAELSSVEHIVVIGGGYVGLEVAATLTKLGKQVTIIEALERVLARVAGVALSRFFQAEHRVRGVEVRLGASVERLEGNNGRVVGVRLADGDRLPADMVIVGIGITPATRPLLAAGAEGGDGVDVDGYCRTSLPSVYAIGDCARHANRFAGGQLVRLESVQNANDMAAAVAATIAGEPKAYDSVPWFWSNQYDIRLQTVGLSGGHDREVVRGDPVERSFSVIYLKRGRVVALDCVNATKDYVQGRALVLAGSECAAERLADASRPLKEIVA